MATGGDEYDYKEESLQVKKAKYEYLTSVPSIHRLKDLSQFIPGRVLHNNANRKTIAIEGGFNWGQAVGIVLLEKTAFSDTEAYFSKDVPLKKVLTNDVYANYELCPKNDPVRATIIYPAATKDIIKYLAQNTYLIDETPEIYRSITLPHLIEEQFDLTWIRNILEHKSESERIVFEDEDPVNGFVLLPDLKWDGTSLDTLYLLAIARVSNVKSLRDLKEEHLALLRNIKEKGSAAIQEKYGLDPSQLRTYLHYQPSFYHLHVHFTYLKYEAPGITAERSHLLSNVISNVELVPDYYQRVTLPFVVRQSDNLFTKFESKGLLKKIEPKVETK